jgi:hypothetical protein
MPIIQLTPDGATPPPSVLNHCGDQWLQLAKQPQNRNRECDAARYHNQPGQF